MVKRVLTRGRVFSAIKTKNSAGVQIVSIALSAIAKRSCFSA